MQTEEQGVLVAVGLVQHRRFSDLVLERVRVRSLLLLELGRMTPVVVWVWELLELERRIWKDELGGRNRSGVGLELVQRL